MDENEVEVTVDLDRLRAVANRVEHSAQALEKFRLLGLDADDLHGSEVGALAGPALVAARFDEMHCEMLAWAATARMAAGRIDDADGSAADRLGHR